MESYDFKCQCNANINLTEEKSLKQHLNVCKNYRGSPYYEFFQKEIAQQPLHKLDAIQLLQLKNEFLQALDLVQNYIDQQNILELKPEGLKLVKFNSSSQGRNSQILNPPLYQNLIQCTSCQAKLDMGLDRDKIYMLDNCGHVFCKPCLVKIIQSDYIQKSGNVQCLSCSTSLKEQEMKYIVGDKIWNDLELKLLGILYNIVTCMQCKAQFEFQSGQWQDAPKDKDGKTYSKEHAEHFANNRFTCSQCKTEQCKDCNVTPYHIGYTCEEQLKFKKALHCRFCNKQIVQGQNKIKALQDICQDEECVAKSKICCLKTLQCGHACAGIINELYCPPCLHDDCAEKAQQELNLVGSDYCNICFVEALNQSPVIRFGCGHIFHYLCVQKKLEVRWPSARVTFTYCLCPLCKQWIDFPVESELNLIMQKNIVKFEEIKKKCQERLKFEDRLKDKQLVDKDSQYFQKPLEYALAIYAYYECYKCKSSYFGGHKNCQQNMDEGAQNFDVKELVCANCCEVAVENCQQHGKEFIEFKCKFCCSQALWFCWGTTHFCEPCHVAHAKVTKLPKDQLPKCPGPELCPLKYKHKPNGEESTLGCSICRNNKANQKQF